MSETVAPFLTVYSKKNVPNAALDLSSGAVFLLDKPPTWSSFRVVKKLRWLTQVKKVGHAGTLDPLATGLLICCVGKATKQIDRFQTQTKQYIAELCFGASTPSYDSETEINETAPWQHIEKDALFKIIETQFSGEIAQIPPMYSALQVDGKRLYTLAQKGISLELKPRIVTIHECTVQTFNPPYATIAITCSKGTYIRSLVHDIGKALDSLAYMTALRRTAIGEYAVDDALTVEEIEAIYARS